jgi:hypothetical protein
MVVQVMMFADVVRHGDDGGTRRSTLPIHHANLCRASIRECKKSPSVQRVCSAQAISQSSIRSQVATRLRLSRQAAAWSSRPSGKVDRSNLTQFGRALAQFRVKHIAANSPEAPGARRRSERAICP